MPSKAKNLGHRLMAWVIYHPWLFIALHLLLFALFLTGAGKVKAGVNVEDFFPKRAPSRLLYDRMAEFFPDDSWGVVLVGSETPNDSPTLLAVKDFEQTLLREQLVYKVKTVLTIKDIYARDGALVPEALVPDPEAPQATLDKRWDDLKTNVRFRGTVVNPKGQLHAIRVQIDPLKKGDALARREFRQVILKHCQSLEQQLIKNGNKKESILVMPTGLPLIRAAYVDLIENDANTLIPLSLLLVTIILLMLFRSLRDILIPLIVVVVSLVWTLGTIGFADIVLNQILQITPIIILIVGVSDSIHLVNRINDRLSEAREDENPKEIMVEACSEIALACFLTSLTTIVGFLSLATTNIESTVDFGIFTSIGIAYAYLITITLLPAVFSLLGKKAGHKQGIRSFWIPMFNWIDRFVAKRKRPILLGSAILTIAALASWNWIDTTAFVFDDLRPDTQLEKDIRYADNEYGGMLPIAIFFEGPKDAKDPEKALYEVETIQAMSDIREMLAKQDYIQVSRGIDLGICQAHYIWFDEDETHKVIPDSRAAIRQFTTLLPKTMTDEFVKGRLAVVLARSKDVGSKKLRPMLENIERELEPHREKLKKYGVTISLTGTTPLVQEVYDSVLSSLSNSVILSVIFMMILFMVMFRSPRAMFFALLPNFLPLILLASCLVLLGITLRPTTMLIFSTAFGIAVDDTIHFIARFRAERQMGVERELAISRTSTQTGAAIVTTSMVLSAGFLVFMFSEFEGLSNFGVLMSLGLVSALFADLLFLPALLRCSSVEFGSTGIAPLEDSEADHSLESKTPPGKTLNNPEADQGDAKESP
ncbi:MAG: efflux RND transporter permease subunit [Planctomycetota bacterium]|nr:efflux RND transporter permease subunit [Planctomycetota bacterium]